MTREPGATEEAAPNMFQVLSVPSSFSSPTCFLHHGCLLLDEVRLETRRLLHVGGSDKLLGEIEDRRDVLLREAEPARDRLTGRRVPRSWSRPGSTPRSCAQPRGACRPLPAPALRSFPRSRGRRTGISVFSVLIVFPRVASRPVFRPQGCGAEATCQEPTRSACAGSPQRNLLGPKRSEWLMRSVLQDRFG
jgi:hypothetical protein